MAKPDRREYLKKWRADNREIIERKRRIWYEQNKALVFLRMRTYVRRLRERVLDKYGRSCECCGETIVQFLAIDHRNGGGRKQRAKFGNAAAFFRWLLKEKREGIRILCHNCNVGREANAGICPHKDSSSTIQLVPPKE